MSIFVFMKQHEKEWLLSLPKENKLMFIEESLKDGDFIGAMEISKVFLDTPISQGGISTDEIKEVMDTKTKRI